MVSVGKITLENRKELKIDGADVVAMGIERTDKTTSGAALWLATDNGCYAYSFDSADESLGGLDSQKIFDCVELLLNYTPYNF